MEVEIVGFFGFLGFLFVMERIAFAAWIDCCRDKNTSPRVGAAAPVPSISAVCCWFVVLQEMSVDLLGFVKSRGEVEVVSLCGRVRRESEVEKEKEKMDLGAIASWALERRKISGWKI